MHPYYTYEGGFCQCISMRMEQFAAICGFLGEEKKKIKIKDALFPLECIGRNPHRYVEYKCSVTNIPFKPHRDVQVLRFQIQPQFALYVLGWKHWESIS